MNTPDLSGASSETVQLIHDVYHSSIQFFTKYNTLQIFLNSDKISTSIDSYEETFIEFYETMNDMKSVLAPSLTKAQPQKVSPYVHRKEQIMNDDITSLPDLSRASTETKHVIEDVYYSFIQFYTQYNKLRNSIRKDKINYTLDAYEEAFSEFFDTLYGMKTAVSPPSTDDA